jgi:hypothetical protein
MKRMSRPSFVLGFAAAIGGLLALGTVALARPHSTPRPATRSVRATGAPSSAPLAVLSQPREAKDDLPAELVPSVADLAGGPELAPEVRNGAVRIGSSHLALSNLGAAKASFYIVPTAKSRVCLVITNGSQGCAEDHFTVAQPATWGLTDVDGYRKGKSTSVDGLVPNNVVRVTVVDDHGARTDARLANNAYYLELPNPIAMPTEIVLGYAGGGSATITLPEITVG